MYTLPKASYRSHAIPIKSPTNFFTEEKTNPEVNIEAQKTPDSPNKPDQKEQFQTDYHAIFHLPFTITVMVKTKWGWHESRLVDQKNKVEDPKMSPHKYKQ